jgi:hypothetical protein
VRGLSNGLDHEALGSPLGIGPCATNPVVGAPGRRPGVRTSNALLVTRDLVGEEPVNVGLGLMGE